MKDLTLDPMIPQPKDMKRNLYPHQLCAVKMMEMLEKRQNVVASSYHIQTKMGIYSDLIGYGKTLAMVALILRDATPWISSELYVKEIISGVFGNGMIVKKTMLITFSKRMEKLQHFFHLKVTNHNSKHILKSSAIHFVEEKEYYL
jgi:hypothetical protein